MNGLADHIWDLYQSGEITRADVFNAFWGFWEKLWTDENGAVNVDK